MREVEPEPPTELRTQLRFAEGVVREAYLTGICSEVASQDLTEGAVGEFKAPPIPFESKARAALPFVRREGGAEASECLGRSIQPDAPAVRLARTQV